MNWSLSLTKYRFLLSFSSAVLMAGLCAKDAASKTVDLIDGPAQTYPELYYQNGQTNQFEVEKLELDRHKNYTYQDRPKSVTFDALWPKTDRFAGRLSPTGQAAARQASV